MYFVYLIVSKNKKRTISYVGYTNNIRKRLKNHNDSKGAKFTRGRKWKLKYFKSCLLYTSDAADDMQCVDLGGRRIIKKKILLKSKAMGYEYKLKKDRKKRTSILKDFNN